MKFLSLRTIRSDSIYEKICEKLFSVSNEYDTLIANFGLSIYPYNIKQSTMIYVKEQYSMHEVWSV